MAALALAGLGTPGKRETEVGLVATCFGHARPGRPSRLHRCAPTNAPLPASIGGTNKFAAVSANECPVHVLTGTNYGSNNLVALPLTPGLRRAAA